MSTAAEPEQQSIFYDEWLACLQAHYIDVVRGGDAVTEPTLHGVLLRVGFSEDEIAQMQKEVQSGSAEESPPQEAPAGGTLPGF